MDGLEEWAFEGKLKEVGETERRLRYQIKHMIVCDERVCNCIKPGGTAGVWLLSQQQMVGGRVFLCPEI